MFEMNTVLNLWLKTTDTQTVLFSRLILVYALIMSLNNPISIIIQATGHVKEYHVPVETFTLLCAPVTYILFKLGYPAYSTYIAMIIAAVASHIVRLICLKKYYKPFSNSEYVKSFLLPAIVVTFVASLFVFLIHRSIMNTSLRIFAVIIFSVICVGASSFLIGLSKKEKDIVIVLITSLKNKFKHC
jgi:hypothetical protein